MEIVINPAKIGNEMSQCVDYILDGVWSEAKQEAAIALEEAFVNVCLYAYDEGEVGVIKIRINKDEKEIVMDIWDKGKEYDPSTAPFKEIEQEQVGGHGVRLMREYCKLVYQREGNVNHLTMIKELT